MSLLREVYAQGVSTTVSNPLAGRFGDLASIFGLIINVVIGVGVALTVIYLALGGIKYITAQGDTKAADEARQALTNAVIGFIVVLGAITIRLIVENILDTNGVTITNVTPTGF